MVNQPDEVRHVVAWLPAVRWVDVRRVVGRLRGARGCSRISIFRYARSRHLVTAVLPRRWRASSSAASYLTKPADADQRVPGTNSMSSG